MSKFSLNVIIVTFIFLTTSVWGFLDINVLESKRFKLLYPPTHQSEAIKMLNAFEHAYSQLSPKLTIKNQKKIILIFEDHGILANGNVSSQYNQLRLYRYYTTHDHYNLSHHNWYRLLAIHELIHYFQFNQSTGLLKIGQSFLGSYFNPNTIVPDSLTEGLAVYYESSFTPYVGRLNDGYADAISQTQKQYNTIPKESHLHFRTFHYPYANWYLYGGLLIQSIATSQQLDQFQNALIHHGNHKRSLILGYTFPQLGIDSSLKASKMTSYSSLYRHWIEDIPSLKTVSTHTILNEYNNSFSKIIAYKQGFVVSHYSGGSPHNYHREPTHQFLYFETPKSSPKPIFTEFGNLLSDIHIVDDTIYYAIYTPKYGYKNYSNNGTGYETTVLSYHIPTHKRHKHFTKAISSFSVDKNHDIWYWELDTQSFQSTLFKAQDGAHIKQFNAPIIVHESIYHNNGLFVSAKYEHSSYDIFQYNKVTRSMIPLTQTNWIEYDLSVSNNTLYYTANYKKQHQRYTLNTISKKTQLLTSEHYSRSGLPFKDQLIYIGLNGNGESIRSTALQTTNNILPFHRKNIATIPDVDFTQYNGVVTNTQTLLMPRLDGLYSNVDQLRVSFYGEDRLQSLQYAVNFNSLSQFNSDIQWRIQTTLISPLGLSISSSTIGYERRIYQANSSYDLYRFEGAGIQRLSLLSNYSKYLNRNDYSLGSSIQFKSPYFSQQFALESRVSTNGHKLMFNHQQKLLTGLVNYQLTKYQRFLFKVPSRSQNPLYLQDQSGYTHELALSIPVYTFNKGFWSPNIYFNTLRIQPFYDRTSIDGLSLNIWEYGIMASIDIYHSLSSHSSLFLGISKDHLKDTEYFYGISIL